MTAPRRQTLRFRCKEIYAEQGAIWALVSAEVYIKARGWCEHGLPQPVQLPVGDLLGEGVSDIVFAEQARQEKQDWADAVNKVVEDQPFPEFGYM